jgi:DNA-binding transcriptional regulator LsrR (DeoR family)
MDNAEDHWGRGAHDALGDEGAVGLHLARKLVKERIVELDLNNEMLSEYIEALDAIELVLNAIGKLEPRRQQWPRR